MGKFGLGVTEDLALRFDTAIKACMVCTYHVHMYRHLKKCMASECTPEILESSKTSMAGHAVTYSAVPSELLSVVMLRGVKEHITDKSL